MNKTRFHTSMTSDSHNDPTKNDEGHIDKEGFTDTSPLKSHGPKFTPNACAIGVTNRTEDNKHILFLDYDHVAFMVMLKDLDMLVKENKASNFFIMQTNEWGYHAICFRRYNFRTIREMSEKTHEDVMHTRLPEKNIRRASVLRVSKKYDLKGKPIRDAPKYIGIYPKVPVNEWGLHSSAHINLYNRLFNVPILPYLEGDKREAIEIVGYKTRDGVIK